MSPYMKSNAMSTILLSLLLILLFTNNAEPSAVSSATVSAASSQRSLQDNCQPTQNLELFSIPPFAVQFTTLDVNDIPAFDTNIVISETDAKASSLTYPLKMATQEFLMAHFRPLIDEMTNPLLQQYYQQLTEVELRIVLKHNPKVTDIPGHVALIATMHGTLHFYHQLGCGGTSLQPSQSEVYVTVGGWLETILKTYRDEYLQRLLGNNQEMLREIVELTLIPNYFKDENAGGSWLLVVWVVVGIAGLGCLGIAGMIMLRIQQKKHVGGDPNFMVDGDQLDSKQHGMDLSAHRRHSLDILSKSDEYLNKYHPDMAAEPSRRGFSIMGWLGFGYSNDKSDNKIATTPRGRSFVNRTRSSIELQAGNIAANSEDPSPFDDINLNHESEEAIMMAAAARSSYSPMSAILHNMTSIFRNSRHETDGIMTNANFFIDDNDEEYLRQQLDEEHLKDEQWLTFMKEEEKEYNFAFKDFPRKDGTPCLIYNGSNNDADDMFTIRSPKAVTSNDDGNQATDMLDEREILSDEAFRQLLNINASPSFEDTTPLDKSSLPPALGYKSPEFNERLSSLFAEKHRQYEKRSIVERHQQKRKKEREMERRERQKDMHRELEALEAGMAMSDKWRAKHHVSPRPYDLSPARSYSPKASIMKRMSSPARPSPMGGRRSPNPHNSRRSPVPMTSSIPPRHSASKSFDLIDGLDGSNDSSSVQLIRPRMSRPPAPASAIKTPPKELFADSRYHLSADLDPSSLDKLSMPSMNKSTTGSSIPPFPLVSDDHIPPPQSAAASKILPPRNPATIHRRVNSTDNLLYLTGNRSGNLETIGAMTPPRRGMSPARRVASPRLGNATRGVSPIRHNTRGISPARNSTGTRGMSPARNGTGGTRGMSPARMSAASPSTRGRRSARGLSPKPGKRSASNSSHRSREGDIFDHGIAALF